MSIRKVYEVINNRLVIELPEEFKGKKKVLVIVEDAIDENAARWEKIKQAAKDPMYLSDMNEAMDDFKDADLESL